MNVLITSAGRRGYLIKYFKEVIDGKIFAGNSNEYAPSFCYADETVVTPLIYEKEYVPFLICYCKRNDISVIIPVFDVDLIVLSKWREDFLSEGINVIVSPQCFVEICNDKWNTYKFCCNHHILTCKSFLNIEDVKRAVKQETLHFPLIVKPRWGMGSLEIFEANDQKELQVLYELCKRNIQKSYLKYEASLDVEHCVIMQEKIIGQEYGVDIFNDLNGKFKCDVVKRKLGMRAGETDAAVVEKNSMIDEFAEKLANLSAHIANLDVDVFISGKKIYLLEMNARFGGGYPFSHLAGVNFPKAIIKMLKGEELDDVFEIKRYNRVMQKDISFVVY